MVKRLQEIFMLGGVGVRAFLNGLRFMRGGLM